MIDNNVTNETNSTQDSIIGIEMDVLAIEISLSIIIVVLNLLNVVLISIRTSKQRTYSNIIFLLNTIADFIVGFISIPGDVIISYTNWNWTNNIIVCVIYKTFDYANSNFSLMLLLLITIHRLLQLKDPYKQNEEMNRLRWILIFMLFLLNYAVWFIIWYVYFNKKENTDVCYFKSFDMFIYVLNCVVSIGGFVLIILMNILIIREFIIKKSKKLVRHNKKRTTLFTASLQ